MFNIIKKRIKDKTKKIIKRLKSVSFTLYIKTSILFITYVLINLVNSWLLRIITMNSYFNFKAIITDAAFIILIGSIAYLLKP